MRKLFLFVVFVNALFSGQFRIASYNVENLFDLNYDKTEYSEYIPNTSTQWNLKTFTLKINNLAQVINEINPNIIALQEVESDAALKALQKRLKQKGLVLNYRAITTKKRSSVHNALLSQYPIVRIEEISPNAYDNLRSTLAVTLSIEGNLLTLFVNHFKSKAGPESLRLTYAKAVSKAIRSLGKEEAYVIVGDLNSNVNEFQTFKRSQKLNDTKGVTGINHIFKTIDNNTLVTVADLKRKNTTFHANLWSELPKGEHASHFYRGKAGTLDHIIISKALVDGKGIEYLPHSFQRFAPSYLLKKKSINNWKRTYRYPVHFTGKGYSDHLPVYADFTF